MKKSEISEKLRQQRRQAQRRYYEKMKSLGYKQKLIMDENNLKKCEKNP